jgi:lipopolysaccharide transport system permease protein
LIYLIPVILVSVTFSTGIGLLLTTFFVQFKDLPRVWGYGMRFYMYALPIVYPTSVIPEKYLWIYNLNPGVAIIEGFRAAMIGTPMPWEKLGIAFLISTVLLYAGAVVFRYREPNIVDAM